MPIVGCTMSIVYWIPRIAKLCCTALTKVKRPKKRICGNSEVRIICVSIMIFCQNYLEFYKIYLPRINDRSISNIWFSSNLLTLNQNKFLSPKWKFDKLLQFLFGINIKKFHSYINESLPLLWINIKGKLDTYTVDNRQISSKIEITQIWICTYKIYYIYNI